MTKQLLFGMLLSLVVPFVTAAEGLLTESSNYSVSETVDRLEALVKAKGFRIFARVDHGAGAQSVDLELLPTKLLIFGKPQGGTRLMQAQRTVGIDLPLKFLVWEDDKGEVRIGWNDTAWMAERHDIDEGVPVLKNVAKALENFARQAGH